MKFEYNGDTEDTAALQGAWLAHVKESVAAGDMKSSSLSRAQQIAGRLGDVSLINALGYIAHALLSEQHIFKGEKGCWEFEPNTFKNRDDLGDAVLSVLEEGKAKAFDVAIANIRTAFPESDNVQTALGNLEGAIKKHLPVRHQPAGRGKHGIRFA